MNGHSDIRQMLIASGIRPQFLQAVGQLRTALQRMGPSKSSDWWGVAYRTCELWQQRFEWALRKDIPDWIGLAAFRSIADFSATRDQLENDSLAGPPTGKLDAAICAEVRRSNVLDSREKFWGCYTLYFEGDPNALTKPPTPENLHSGKPMLGGEMEASFLSHLDSFQTTLGGQAGNILWLWHSIGAQARGYVPFLPAKLVHLSKRFKTLGDLRFFNFADGELQNKTLKRSAAETGVQTKGGPRVGAPSGGSVVTANQGRRLICQFKGLRDLEHQTGIPMPWDEVQFHYKGQRLSEKLLDREDPNDITWPAVPLFSESLIDGKTLMVRLVEPEELKRALSGRVDFAVIGGVDMLLRDGWISRDRQLQVRLLTIAGEQLRALAGIGIRIGVELSGVPGLEYATFLRGLCAENIVVAIGINGEDELPLVVQEGLESKLCGAELDLEELPKDLRDEARDPKRQGEHFEYLTWLKARRLAEALGVRTLYVHTTSLDFILRKNADPGALQHAQMGDMMGKGLVIAALLKREYREQWLREVRKMPPALKPEAMARLASFAADFEDYQRKGGAGERILRSGYWLAPSPDDYSMAVVPVMWPSASEAGKGFGLPERLNPTGSGDMTFGAFFFLGGV